MTYIPDKPYVYVTVVPDEQILRRFAQNLFDRAIIHDNHAILFEKTGLTVDDMWKYFHDVLIARTARVETITGHMSQGNYNNAFRYFNGLAIPAVFAQVASYIGEFEAEEHVIIPKLQDNYVKREVVEVRDEDNPIFYLTKTQHHKISNAFERLNGAGVIPSNKQQIGNSAQGGEAMLGVVDYKQSDLVPASVEVRSFTGNDTDEFNLEMSILMGLKPLDTNLTSLLWTRIHAFSLDTVVNAMAIVVRDECRIEMRRVCD